GVTAHDCVLTSPAAAVAVTWNLFAIRDWPVVGVQVIVWPLNAAPAGAVVSAKLTAVPPRSVAAIWYVLAAPSAAWVPGVVVKRGPGGGAPCVLLPQAANI